MRTRIMPAQITNVEDKIAGSLSFTQVFILIFPVFFVLVIFTVFPPKMQIVLYKFLLSLFFSIFMVILALRIKGKIVVDWLLILISYCFRAKYYVYDKNVMFMRPKSTLIKKDMSNTLKVRKYTNKKSALGLCHQITLDKLIKEKNTSMIMTFHKKGGINVALQKTSR